MPQQLSDLFEALNQGGRVGPGGFLLLTTISLLSSLFIAYLYVHFYSTRATGSQVHRAFPLLGVSVTAIFVTIQFSLPLSLGLLGALSIVRFRTPIKEPEEIGFLMLVIAVSLATATFQLAFVGITLAVGVAALLLQLITRRFGWGALDGTIVVSLPSDSTPIDPGIITRLLRRRLPRAALESVSQTGTETVVSYRFQGLTEAVLTGLQAELAETAGRGTYHVFVNRPGSL